MPTSEIVVTVVGGLLSCIFGIMWYIAKSNRERIDTLERECMYVKNCKYDVIEKELSDYKEKIAGHFVNKVEFDKFESRFQKAIENLECRFEACVIKMDERLELQLNRIVERLDRKADKSTD